MLGLPRKVRQEVYLGPRRVRAPRKARIRKKKKKSKIRGGGYLCSGSTTRETNGEIHLNIEVSLKPGY